MLCLVCCVLFDCVVCCVSVLLLLLLLSVRLECVICWERAVGDCLPVDLFVYVLFVLLRCWSCCCLCCDCSRV